MESISSTFNFLPTPIHATWPPVPSGIRTLRGTPGSTCTLRLQAGSRPTFQAGPDRPPPTSKPGPRAALPAPSPGAPSRPAAPAPHPRGNWAPAPHGHLHPATVGRRLLGARPLAQAGFGSVSSPSGHRQLQLRLPLHPPGSGAGPELRRLLRLGAFRHPPAPPSPPGARRPATGHLPLGLGPDCRDRRPRACPRPRVRTCVRARARLPLAGGGRSPLVAGRPASRLGAAGGSRRALVRAPTRTHDLRPGPARRAPRLADSRS